MKTSAVGINTPIIKHKEGKKLGRKVGTLLGAGAGAAAAYVKRADINEICKNTVNEVNNAIANSAEAKDVIQLTSKHLKNVKAGTVGVIVLTGLVAGRIIGGIIGRIADHSHNKKDAKQLSLQG